MSDGNGGKKDLGDLGVPQVMNDFNRPMNNICEYINSSNGQEVLGQLNSKLWCLHRSRSAGLFDSISCAARPCCPGLGTATFSLQALVFAMRGQSQTLGD